MKKQIALMLIPLLIIGLLTGCAKSDKPAAIPTQTLPTQAALSQTAPTQAAVPETQPRWDPAAQDSYWVAYAWYCDDGFSEPGFQPLEEEYWSMDLIVRADGTGRFREVMDRLYLVDEADLDLTWQQLADGSLEFFNWDTSYPVIIGQWADDILTAHYRGTTLLMRQAPIPQAVGDLYCPAELAGTWVMVSGETEGWEWEAMPGRLESLVFSLDYSGNMITLTADMEERDYYGELVDARYGQTLEILPEPLYPECVNGVWSVRIGPASPLDSNGFPLDTEYTVTLLDRNTLLMERYYTIDGYPAVSHQTYRRIPEQHSWWNITREELEDTRWVCTGYLDASGQMHSMMPGMKDFFMQFGRDTWCQINTLSRNDKSYRISDASWTLGAGGTLLIQNEDNHWFGGAVRGFCTEREGSYINVYELCLYYQGGILYFTFDGYG